MNDIMNKLLTALAALAVMVSCGNSDEPKQEESILTVTTKSLSFDYSGGTQTVNVVSSIDPGINCKDSWLTVTKGEYLDKNVQLTIVAATNTTSSARKGNVSINGDKKTITIEVTQGVLDYPLEVDKTSLSFTYAGGGAAVTASSTSEVTISGGADWCKATAGKQGEDRKTEITVLAGPNLSGASRSTSFAIKCGGESKTVDVTQPALGTIATASATALTQESVYDMLKMGWNLGNQMDANNNGIAGESPLDANQVTSSGNLVNAWSDGNAPTEPTLCYYAANRQFRTPALSSGEFEFSGGRFLMTKSTMWPKTFSPAVLRFPHGLEIMDQAVIRINDSGVKNVEIDGPVAFSRTSTIHPAGAVNVESSGIAFLGAAQSGVEAEVAVRPYAEGQRGCFSLAGGTDWFLGKVFVSECDYLMGANGVPQGTLALATNAVLRLSAPASGDVPEVKNLFFAGDVASTFEVVCDGAASGAVRVTGAFSASVPPQVVLSGTLPREAARLEVLRAPAGQISLASFAPMQSQIGGMSIEWMVANDGGESILAAKITPAATVLIMR